MGLGGSRLKICVFGLWHLGSVTAACLAKHHQVVGLDFDKSVIEALLTGRAPIQEPGLDALIQQGLASGNLVFTNDSKKIGRDCEVVWVTLDTPVDDDDVADNASVIDAVGRVLPILPEGCVVLVSSQLPVGSCATLKRLSSRSDLFFACCPENLRLGKAIAIFENPDRVILGTSESSTRQRLQSLFAPITERIIWMSPESAEMTKHAINSFLALSIVFMNELALLCEANGADASEVEQGLKSESRIGPGAYLSPGSAFAGGTLARDVVTLSERATAQDLALSLIPSIKPSNDHHRQWEYRTLVRELGSLVGRRILILGLAYKVGTNTLRRSSSIELINHLIRAGADVSAFDPIVSEVDPEVSQVALASSLEAGVKGAEAIVLMTPWPLFLEAPWGKLLAEGQPDLIFVDANKKLFAQLKNQPGLRYRSVGRKPIMPYET